MTEKPPKALDVGMPNARAGFYADAARIAALYEMHDEMERWWRKAVAAGAGPDHAALTEVAALVGFAADPVLEVTDPSDGVVVRAASVTVRGELAKGRTTDEVLVNGNPVRKGPGAFTATVATGVGGPLTIEVSVEESGQRRGTAVRRIVHYDALPRAVQDFLSGWAAAYGVETDEVTGYPKRIQRTRDSALMVLIPAMRSGATSESPRGGTAAVESPRDPANSIGAFYLDETAVTVAQWRAFAESGGGTMPARLVGYGPQAPIPVARGSDEAKAYATWAQAVLPTDAQWAWAANGGWVAEGGGDHGTAARGAASSGGGDFTYRIDAVPTNVRQQPPNGYGLYGMGVRTSTSFRCASRSLPDGADGHADQRP